MWTRKLSNQLNLARQCPLSLVQVLYKICGGSPEGIRVTTEEKICERDEF